MPYQTIEIVFVYAVSCKKIYLTMGGRRGLVDSARATRSSVVGMSTRLFFFYENLEFAEESPDLNKRNGGKR